MTVLRLIPKAIPLRYLEVCVAHLDRDRGDHSSAECDWQRVPAGRWFRTLADDLIHAASRGRLRRGPTL